MVRLAFALALILAAPAVSAGERGVIGWSHVIVNDSIGEFRDRWQSSVVQGSVFLGAEERAGGPFRFGEVLEMRLTSQIVTPENIGAPAPGDRPFAGALGLELFSHGHWAGAELSAGAGIVAIGPQTGTFRFQRWLHDILGYPRPDTEGNEIGNGFHPVLSVEAGRGFGEAVRLRPFVEARGGLETLLRVGADVSWGELGRGDLMVREPVTGQRVPGVISSGGRGLSLFAGADVAWVEDSVYLPASRGFDPEVRGRLRTGVHWRNDRLALFYGLTYLTPEFDGQPEGQFLGAVQLRFAF